MPRRIEDCTEELTNVTHFTDVRDLFALWTAHAAAGLPDLSVFDAFLAGPGAVHVLLLTGGDEDLIYRRVGRNVERMFGHNPLGRRLDQLNNGGVELYRARYHAAIRGGHPLFCVEHSLERALIGSSERLLLPVATSDGGGILVYVRLREDGNAILRAIFDASADGIFVLRPVPAPGEAVADFRIIAANREVASRVGAEPSGLVGRLFCDIYPVARETGLFDFYRDTLALGAPAVRTFSYEFRGGLVEREIRVVPLDDGLVVTTVDIGPLRQANRDLERRAVVLAATNDAYLQQAVELGEEVRRNQLLQRELERLAHLDGLTGVANRSHFEVCFEETLEAAATTGTEVAIAILDLDHFKSINDSLGHGAGDMLLREIAGRISAALGPGDLVGRLGGDEFAIAVVDRGGAEPASAAMAAIIESLGRPYVAEHRDLSTSVSAGVAVFPEHGRIAADLLSNADIAVYQAKRAGRGRIVRFEPAMRAAVETRFRLLARFRQALEAGEIVPFYQPVMRAQTGRLDGFEVLARWRHPEDGVLTPARFLDVFDEPDLSVALGEAMVDQLIADLRRWGDAVKGMNFGVNVTGYDLRQPSFAARLVDCFARGGISPRSIVIEVTEGVILSRDGERVLQAIADLRTAGFRIALDDFGTGYASLSHLRSLPADIIKIDASFVRRADTDEKSAAIIHAIVALAGAFGLKTVAEGVETEAEYEVARRAGCNAVQGFLFSPALPACDVPAILPLALDGQGATRRAVPPSPCDTTGTG
ncbi:putative bifunctional diguanylate cyclase/phosphodiesterase [Methylobrevis albus]|uniref:Bifunctional diguanylate cyclase/phosphodiesterase n=1 Tax=Methylobrevis albus TaxID=2793297 RepID=A0A931MY35_9HYPH|nr:bifunctional diguanylate cyclase/phosphodiesterase [Methylobrevis albus]MBH0236306.1 bifunctional diguanylate cyclase/phosphodiesterase [Methylobrevis albus]